MGGGLDVAVLESDFQTPCLAQKEAFGGKKFAPYKDTTCTTVFQSFCIRRNVNKLLGDCNHVNLFTGQELNTRLGGKDDGQKHH